MEAPLSWGKPGHCLSADPLLALEASRGQAPQFRVSSVQHGDSTCSVQEERRGPGAAREGWLGETVGAHPRCVFHTTAGC